MKKHLALLCVIAVAACGKAQRPEPIPIVETKEVKVAVPVPCKALASLGPEPAYPDSDAAIAAEEDVGKLAKMYAKGRLLRVQRLAEYAVAKASCVF